MLKRPRKSVPSESGLASPGMLPIHYAPRTPAWRIETAEGLSSIAWPARSALLVFGTASLPDLPDSLSIHVFSDSKVAGQSLYAMLHRLDALELERIVILMPPDQPEWTAIRDRLTRAARPPRS